jgi:glycerophosphoryl diester phosphodiesterase
MLSNRFHKIRTNLRSSLKPAIAFEFWFTMIFLVPLAPATGWLLNRMVAASGQYAVSDNDLIVFFLSSQGIAFLILSIAFALSFWFAEQVGLLIISIKAAHQKKVSVSLVLWEQITHLAALFRLGLLQAGAYLVLSVPFLLGLGLTYWLLLREWDLYFYLNVRPLSWWIALAVGGTILVAFLLLAAWLYIRWLFSIPILVYENTTPREAMRNSWRQTRGRFLELATPLAVCWIGVIILSVTTTWLVSVAATRFLNQAGLTLKVVVPAVVVTLALIAVLDIMWFIVGKIVHVMLMADFYRDHAGADQTQSIARATAAKLSPTALKAIGWGITAIVVIVGIISGVAFLEGFNIHRKVDFTGHRGSKVRAPENTLSALRQAIDEGADYAEIDVQTTADGMVVLLHDVDLMRVASINRRLRDMNYNELKDIDVGSWFDPEFSSERIPTLQEAMDLARGRIKLNIELKYTWPDPALTQKVGNIIRQKKFAADCVVSSLNFQAVTEVKQAFPELSAGFIVFTVAGNLARMEADFLSINAARATPRLVRQLHERGRAVHVWTVNDFNNFISMIEMGVDNIITDHPRDLRRYLEAWNALSDYEKIALMLRNLIVGIDRPHPEEL